MNNNKMNTKVVALTVGLIWPLYLLGISIIAMYFDVYGHNVADFIMTIYPGYDLSLAGVGTGMLYAFLDGFFFGLIFSLIYNKVLQCECLK